MKRYIRTSSNSSNDISDFFKSLKRKIKNIVGDSFDYLHTKVLKRDTAWALRIYNTGDALLYDYVSSDQLYDIVEEACNETGVSNDSVSIYDDSGSRYMDHGYIDISVRLDDEESREISKQKSNAKPGRKFAAKFLDDVADKFGLSSLGYRAGTKTSIQVYVGEIPSRNIARKIEDLARNSEGFRDLTSYESSIIVTFDRS